MSKSPLLEKSFHERNYYSWIAVAVIFIVIVLRMLWFALPDPTSWDLFGSHIYLPMLFDKHQFVYHDISWMDQLREQYNSSPTLYQVVQWENGSVTTRNTCGWAMLMLPFYLIAEVWASVSGEPTDGFSYPYQFMIVMGALFYSLLSFVLLRKVLLHFFSDRLSALVLLILVFGTNLLFIQFASPGSTHNLEFFLVTLMLYLAIKLNEKITYFNLSALAATIALIGLIRPPDILLAVIPFFWFCKTHGGIKAAMRKLKNEYGKELILSVLIGFCLIFPQLLYWKVTTGKFLVNSYKNPGEGFDWFNPHLTELLFSYRKGFFLYTPLMLLSVVGFIFWIRKQPFSGKPAAFAVIIFVYVASTWTNWWYAGSFGQRALVDIYPVMAVSLGFLLLSIQKRGLKIILGTVVSLCVFLNLFQTWQMSNGIISSSQMTKKYYWSIFGQTNPPSASQFKMLLPDEDINKPFAAEDEKDYKLFFSNSSLIKKPFVLKEGVEFGETIEIDQKSVNYEDYAWLRVTWKYGSSEKSIEGKIFTWFVKHGNETYYWRGSDFKDPHLHIDTVNKTISSDFFKPPLRSKDDIICTSVWNQAGAGEPLVITGAVIKGYVLRDPLKYK